MRALVDADPPPHAVEDAGFVDSRGAAKLGEIHQLLEAEGVSLRLARVKRHVLRVLRADGVIDLVGDDHVHGSVHAAVEAQRAADRERHGD